MISAGFLSGRRWDDDDDPQGIRQINFELPRNFQSFSTNAITSYQTI